MKPKINKDLLILLPLCVFLVLLALFFCKTDLTVDEAFHSIYSHQIAIILHGEMAYVTGGIIIVLVLLYLILVRRNLWVTLAAAVVAVAARFILDLPTTIHNIHPPLFNMLNALLITFSSLDVFAAQPQVTGIIISIAAMLFLSISTFFIARQLWGSRISLLTSSLLLISPVAIFYSSTALLNPLAVALAYSSIMFFLLGLKRPAFIPFSGLLMAAAIWTRFDVLLITLGLFALALVNRRTLLSKEHRKGLAIFGIILAAAIAIQAPVMAKSFGIYSSWYQHETYAVETAHYSTYMTDAMGSNPMRISQDFYVRLIGVFYTPLILVTFIAGMLLALKRKNHAMLLIGLIGLIYMVGFSLSGVIQTDRYVLFFDFPLIMLTGFLLDKMTNKNKARKISYILFTVLVALFIFSNYIMISNHNFSAVSEFVRKIPNNSVIYADQPDVALYHSFGYLCKLEGCTNNPTFWERFVPLDVQLQHNITVKFSYDYDRLKLMEISDYFIISEYFFGRAPEDHKNYLLSLNRCGSVLHNQAVMFEFYARGRCPLNKTIRA